jgi:hypothetical protein
VWFLVRYLRARVYTQEHSDFASRAGGNVDFLRVTLCAAPGESASVVPPGFIAFVALPKVETLGYSQMSLRDRGAFPLVAVLLQKRPVMAPLR